MAKKAGVLLTLLLFLGAGVVLMGGVVGAAYTSSSTFCASCHEMSTRYVSWTRSTHNQVECMDCHSGVGIGGYINAKIGGARQAFQHYFGEIGNIHAVVEDPVCMKCHYFDKSPGFAYDPAFHDDPLYVPDDLHKVHFKDKNKDKEPSCNGCHAGLVHGSLDGGAPIDKQVCTDCHRSRKVLVDIVYDGKTWTFPNWIKR